MSDTARRTSVTIKDVAERAGVSQMTVSRVLNNKSVVSEDTRRRVKAAMRALNYRPNLMARSLAGRQGLFIGLLYRNPSYGYLSEFLLGALEACREMGHYLVVEEPLMHDEMIDLDYLEARFLDTSIQAVIVVPPLSDDLKLIGTLSDAAIDSVGVTSNFASKLPSVGIDDHRAAAEMTRYLLGLGHRRIGVIGGAASHLTGNLRLDGFRAALEEAGIAPCEDLIVPGDFTYRSGIEGAERLFGRSDPPTAVFALNDDIASGAITGAYRAQMRVPEDVTIVGFDDTANAAALWPPLTTVRQPIRQIARSAIDLLVRRVEDPAQARTHVCLDYEIVVRQSSGPPRDA